MPIYEFRCECGAVFDEFAPVGTRTSRCACGRDARKAFTPPSVVIPAWMADDAMDGRRKHREWLRSAEAKKLDLNPVPWDE
jgi:putative FmdB family regulatory protein